jgi:methionyl-tRNA formyltransferase
MNLVYFGTPEFAVTPLKTLLNSGYEVLAVVTQPDRQSGRGRHISACPVKIEAQKSGIETLQPLKVRNTEFLEKLRSINPSVIVVAAYGQILPPEIIHLPAFGCVNIHASLLPKYRGAAPVNWSIINGEKKTGITTMLMDEGMDTGPILLQEEVEITSDDTAGSLSGKLSKIGSDLLIHTLKALENRMIKPVPQTGEASYAPLLKKTDGLVNWSRSAGETSNFIRGMNPWPGAYGFLEGERIKILKVVSLDESGEAGKIKRVSKDEMIAGAVKGSISILEIQPQGKPVMTIRSFLQGRKIREGMRFSLTTEGTEE